ncbi:hypothetical protein FRB96_005212 [Tulasnella sp. 330]|nr:hypothetical protein FRB96_005212 [Tulasnella sp. 330]KAG8884876.1 hypothetical protein FRB97_003083 [Tulasnella sp. 331]
MSSIINPAILEELQNLSRADYLSILVPLAIVGYVGWTSLQKDRRTVIEQKQERVFVVGASSGIGRQIALDYAARGAIVAIMGRRKVELETVGDECLSAGAPRAISIVGDFAVVDNVLKARNVIKKELGGLDTLIVSAGVSALQPLLTGVALAERDSNGDFTSDAPSREGIQQAQDVAARAMTSNYVGPLVTATTFIPMLELTSKAPAILLISSAAAIMPAPTRSLYCSTKGASLLLYQSLAIEHPKIQFSNIIAATVEGNFRAGAVDSGPVRESVTRALTRKYVSEVCVDAIDRGKRNAIIPGSYRVAHALYWIYPNLIHRLGRNKYNFT